jgi:hypothetical protein
MMRSITHTYQANHEQLNTIINGWDLIPDNGDIDSLAEKILTRLYKAANLEPIKGIIESELTITQGLFNAEFNTETLAAEIVSWWHT